MRETEAHGLSSLFKLKQTKRVKGLIAKLCAEPVCARARQGWDGVDTTLQFQGWGQARQVVVLRRRVKGSLLLRDSKRTTRATSVGLCRILGATPGL